MHDGPDDRPPPDDDVLDRLGLRDATPSSTGAGRSRRAADEPDDDEHPWPPRRRALRSAADVRDAGASRARTRAGRDRRADPDGAGATGAHRDPDDVPGRSSGPRHGGADAANQVADGYTAALPTVPPVPPTRLVPPVPPAQSVPPAQPDEPPRRTRTGRRPGAADSRHTEVMPSVPRRRARDTGPDPDDVAEQDPRAPGRTAARPEPAPERRPEPGPDRTETAAGPGEPPDEDTAASAEPPGQHAPPRRKDRPTDRPTDQRTDRRAADTRRRTRPRGQSEKRPEQRPDKQPGKRPGKKQPGKRPEERPAAAEPARAGEPPDGNEPPPSAGRRVLRIGAAAVAVLVFAVCAFGFTSRQDVYGGIRTVAALQTESDAISSRSTQAGDENVLVVGLPADRGRVPEAQRGDTAVLVHLPAGGAPAVTLGLPPTLEVPRPPCQRWDAATGSYAETVPAESRTAFSATYDVGGPRCTVEVVQQLTGLMVTRFVVFDMAGTAALVNAVRGVPVCTERPVVDRTLGPVVTRPGNTVLAGSEAERFVAATGVDDTSPMNRVQRQQRVVAAALERALSTSSLLTPGAADRVARALPGAVLADGAGAAELMVLARSLAGASGDAAPPYVSVPVTDQPNTRGHLELRRSDASELFSALRKHEPLPEDVTAPAPRAAVTALPPGTAVDVLNAAGRPGLAGEVADTLRAQGYAVGAVRDAPPVPDSVLRFSPDRSDAAGVLAASVPSVRPESGPAGTGTLELVLGTSFPGPAAVGPPAQSPTPSVDCG